MGDAVSERGSDLGAVMEEAARHAESMGVFASVRCDGSSVVCEAAPPAEDVAYRLELADGALYAAWTTPDRYMSQSIEADLMWTGDDLDDMIDEELVDLGWAHGKLAPLEHYRDERSLYIFRSRVPLEPGSLDPERHGEALAKCLGAYEAAFRELGDMQPDEDA